jgi:hypothetical protein
MRALYQKKYYSEHFGAQFLDNKLQVVNVGDKQFLNGDDIVFLHVHCITNDSPEGPLIILYQNEPIFTLDISTGHSFTSKISVQNRHFMFFKTHQIELNEDEKSIKTIYVTIENNSLSFNDMDSRLQLEPHLDVFDAPPHVKFNPLNYIPLHPDDPLLEEALIYKIAQRTPTWFALRGMEATTISGTSLGKYTCGYWLTSTEDNKAKTTMETVREQIRSANNMRFGRLNEDSIALIVMHNFPSWTYYEYGSIGFDFTKPSIQSLQLITDNVHYNCSPDGLAVIAEQEWKHFPAHVVAHYKQFSDIDPKLCLLEYKASYMSTKLPDYYLVQLYCGMMATSSLKAFLVRYKKRRGQQANGRWGTIREAHGYVVYRDPVVEQHILKNLKESLLRSKDVSLNDQVTQATYVELRQRFSDIAAAIVPIQMTIPYDVLDKYEKKKYACIQATKP